VKVFGCSCCPPNILRFINSIGDFLYTEDTDTLYVHHYMNSTTQHGDALLRQSTRYPAEGSVKLEVSGPYKQIAVRVPGWCSDFTASAPYEMHDGYAYFDAAPSIELHFSIRPQLVVSAPGVHDNAGKAALMYGPVVYCIEGVDNEGDIFGLYVNENAQFELTDSAEFGLPVIDADGYTKVFDGRLYAPVHTVQYDRRKLHFIPYYAMENRGETDMLVWIPIKA
jgi:DUF1680 family protein